VFAYTCFFKVKTSTDKASEQSIVTEHSWQDRPFPDVVFNRFSQRFRKECNGLADIIAVSYESRIMLESVRLRVNDVALPQRFGQKKTSNALRGICGHIAINYYAFVSLTFRIREIPLLRKGTEHHPMIT